MRKALLVSSSMATKGDVRPRTVGDEKVLAMCREVEVEEARSVTYGPISPDRFRLLSTCC